MSTLAHPKIGDVKLIVVRFLICFHCYSVPKFKKYSNIVVHRTQ